MAKHVYGAVAEFLSERFKGIVRESEVTPTVGTTAVEIVGHDSERVSLFIANHGAADVYISPTNQVSVTRGIRLGAGGGAMSVNVEDDANLPSLSWWGISASAGNAVYGLLVKRDVAIHDSEHAP